MNRQGHCDAPLSDEEVRAIRALRGSMSQVEIAKLYNRTQAAISAVMRGATYRHVEDDAISLPAELANVTLGQMWPWFKDHERRDHIALAKRLVEG